MIHLTNTLSKIIAVAGLGGALICLGNLLYIRGRIDGKNVAYKQLAAVYGYGKKESTTESYKKKDES